jgi:hypothetical protein
MTDEERQRTMDFILQHQAQFAAGMQRLEGQQTQFAGQQAQFAMQQAQFASTQQRSAGRIDRLERVVLLMARQFRRERRDLRERVAALVDAQIKTEEAVRAAEEAVRSLAATTERNSMDIATLAKATKSDDKANGEGDGGDASS